MPQNRGSNGQQGNMPVIIPSEQMRSLPPATQDALREEMMRNQLELQKKLFEDQLTRQNSAADLAQTLDAIHDLDIVHRGVAKGGYSIDSQIQTTSGNLHIKSSNKVSSSCYVATATYQNAYHPNVVILRDFRDRHLRHSLWGRAFISVYYTIGKYLAILPAHSAFVRAVSKKALDRIVLRIVKKHYLKYFALSRGRQS